MVRIIQTVFYFSQIVFLGLSIIDSVHKRTLYSKTNMFIKSRYCIFMKGRQMMDMYEKLKNKLENKDFAICILGIGRVGLPLALSFAEKNILVYGVDKNSDLLSKLRKRIMPFIEEGAQALLDKSLETGKLVPTEDIGLAVKKSDVIIVTVGTPLDIGLRPDYDQLKKSLEELVKSLEPGKLIILRSTVSAGNTEKIVIPYIKEKTGLEAGVDFWIAACPERIVEGRAIEEIKTLPELIGGYCPRSTTLASTVLSILGPDKKMIKMDPTSAELAKLFTNVFRYVTFALSNEYALLAENYGRSAYEIIRALNDDYPRGGVPLPGPAGGPCLFKDGYYLVHDLAFPDFVLMAWRLNEAIPAHVVNRIKKGLQEQGKQLRDEKVAVLGLAYKADIDDSRYSPSKRLVELLLNEGAKVSVNDPYFDTEPLDKALLNAGVVVLATPHSAYKELNPKHISELVSPTCFIFDCWNFLDKKSFSEAKLPILVFGEGP